MTEERPILAVTYVDHAMTWDEDDYDPTQPYSPIICTVVGYSIREEAAWMHIAAEKEGDSWRAVTHVFAPAVLNVVYLIPRPRKGAVIE